MHLQPVFASCPAYVNGVSERLFARGLCLPSGTGMREQGLERVIGHVLALAGRDAAGALAGAAPGPAPGAKAGRNGPVLRARGE